MAEFEGGGGYAGVCAARTVAFQDPGTPVVADPLDLRKRLIEMIGDELKSAMIGFADAIGFGSFPVLVIHFCRMGESTPTSFFGHGLGRSLICVVNRSHISADPLRPI